MCGFAGSLRFDGARADLRAVERMVGVLAPRGPDGIGTWTEGPVALGHRRLQIIDVSERGAQPMVDEDLGAVIVFNGCIYNHAELRRELEAEGYRFRSTSDTEVILKAHHRWGSHAVHHLVGMFAYALHWTDSGRTLLVRDRLGIKPLYVADTPDALHFASTVPALLAGGGVDPSLDPEAIHHYFSFHSIVPGTATVLGAVEQIAPGTTLSVERDGRRSVHRWWTLPGFRDPQRSDWQERDWQDALTEALATAVRRRMVADVEVGVLLSGGLDSSLIVALLAEHGHEISTFSIGFETGPGGAGDEFRWSDLVAQHFGTRHHRIRHDDHDLVDAMAGAIGAMSEPMASHDVVAWHLLAQRVAAEVKVVQSGQGADEVFAGYRWFQALRNAPPDRAAEVYLDGFRDRSARALAKLLHPDLRPPGDPSGELVSDRFAAVGAATALDRALSFEVTEMLPADPLLRVDNLTMASGLEARVPFLDADLVALAASCPPELKLAEDGKGALKEIGRKLLPAAVVDRPKGYFPVPALVHLEGPVLAKVREVVTDPAARRRGLLAEGVVDRLLAEPNRRMTTTGNNLLWHLAVLEWWLQEHVDR